MAASDLQALGVIDAAMARGLRVPEELAVADYNDIAEGRYADLTSVRVPMREMGRQGAEIALCLIAGGVAPAEPIRLPGEFVVLQTTGGGSSVW